ncbi:MAG TPA: polysaccharide deacetylase family protein [Pirellulaceae bacterium]|nr:polysaccharide deacetylase family protein [Pirellulaceae bacterium]HMO93433.1 polysaccharide deacetylase family protein [Pirellulaceae bacterium]HMP68459.1 polysaccharide deacetylase family protein [Pirellulaceae bacterium]
MTIVGKFVISLDFELVWGLFDHADIYRREHIFLETQRVVPQVLNLAVGNEVRITWATVGMLMLNDWDDWDQQAQELDGLKPGYNNERLSPYRFGQFARQKMSADCFFSPEHVRAIVSAPGQELATHTFSHYYCLEPGQTVEHFRADLQLAQNIAQRFDSRLSSLVFPRNQFQPEYLAACHSAGIAKVRTNPGVWYWTAPQLNSLAAKAVRTADAYLPFRSKAYSDQLISQQAGVTLEPASRFLRPHSRWTAANWARLQRVKAEMTDAARRGLIYHLWWHPHNFGRYPVESMATLKMIFRWYHQLRDEFGMQSATMQEVQRPRFPGQIVV